MADKKTITPYGNGSNKDAYSLTYWRMRPSWNLYLDLYEPLTNNVSSVAGQGGAPTVAATKGSLSQFLFKYKSEDAEEYSSRLQRVAQVNFLEYIVQYWSAILFSSPLQFSYNDSVKDKLDAFIANCNGRGDTLEDYARDVIVPSTFIYGITDLVVDMPKTNGETITLDTEAEYQPYCYVVPPLNRLDWQIDKTSGRYCRYRSYDIINTQIQPQMGVTDVCQYQDWTDKEVASYDTSGSETSSITNPYGFIPIVPFTFKSSLRFFDDAIGISLVKDIAPLQRLMINILSLIMDWQEQTNFALRYMIQDVDGGYDDDTDAPVEGDGVEMSSKRVVKMRGKGSSIGIMTPDPAGANNMQTWLGQLVDMMFMAAGLPTDIGENKTHQSGVTVRANYSKILNTATIISKTLAKHLKKTLEYSLKVQGLSDKEIAEADVQVIWHPNYSFQSFGQAVEELIALKSVMADIAPSAVAAFSKMTMASRISSSEEYEESIKETDEWVEKQKNPPEVDPITGVDGGATGETKPPTVPSTLDAEDEVTTENQKND